MSTTERISLTDDTARQAMLRRKLEEYSQRLRTNPRDVDSSYKIVLLNELLTSGSVDVVEFREKAEIPDDRCAHAFHQAVMIIVAYNSGDTSYLRGGTGLR